MTPRKTLVSLNRKAFFAFTLPRLFPLLLALIWLSALSPLAGNAALLKTKEQAIQSDSVPQPSLHPALISNRMELLKDPTHPLHIVHIGDSHLQSGYTGESLRATLGKEFVVAGYGLISPYKIAGSNAPSTYRYTSPQKWQDCTLSYAHSCETVPPTCILLERTAGDFSFDVKSIVYPFDGLVCFRSPNSPTLIPAGKKYHLARGTDEYSGIVADTIRFEHSEQSVTLKPLQRAKGKVAYGGLILLHRGAAQNDARKPLLYSEVALNGAMFASYDRKEVLKAIAGLHPQLVVVSLGTNEALAKGFRLEAFRVQAESFLKHLRRDLPHCTILLVSPPPSFQKRGSFNNRTKQIAALLGEIAARDGYHFFDLYEALGGKKEAERRKSKGEYYNRDGIHFTVAGYHEHGRILGKAIAELLE